MKKEEVGRKKEEVLLPPQAASKLFTFYFLLFPSRYRTGFTFLETLTALAVLALLATVIVSGLSSFRESAALDQAVDEALEILREARSKTLGSESALSYGVHFAAADMILFKGGAYGAGDPANTVIPLPSSVTITNISLSTTTASVVFERLSGASYATGTLTFTTRRSLRSKSVQVSESGLVFISSP